MVNPNRFYTYAYLREDRSPYYIGKGEKDRIYKKGKGEVKPPKDKSRVIFLKQNLTEAEAFRHEIYMIVVFGRKDLGTGILHNRTDGGDGASGLIHTPEHRAKISAARKGKTLSPETKEKMSAAKKGIPRSPETKEKMSAANKGKTLSPETRAKLSAANKGKTLSLETKEKMSAANKGENNPMYGKILSLETKAKISDALKGKNNPMYGRTGENNPNYGKTYSPETRAKMSAAKKGEIWITNGIQSRRISKNDIIPEGFGKGRTLTKLAQ